LIQAAGDTSGETNEEILRGMEDAGRRFGEAIRQEFGTPAE
jgi:hypothetical protein